MGIFAGVMSMIGGHPMGIHHVFEVQRVGRCSLRSFLAKALTISTAARIHRAPLDEFLSTLEKAVHGGYVDG